MKPIAVTRPASGGSAIESLRASLRKGETLPNELERLVDYGARVAGGFAGDFELLDDGRAALRAWFADREEPASQLLAFGKDGTGALFAIWRHGPSLAESPVVFLGSEGETIVLASSMREFLGLLAYAVDDLGFVDWEEEPPAASNAPAAVAFRAFLRQELGIEPTSDPSKQVLAARERHHDFEAFVMGAIA